MHLLEDRREFRIVERAAVDVGEDLDAAGAQGLDRALHLLERRLDVVHRHRGDEAGEALRVLGDDLRHAVIGDARQLGRALGRGDEFDRRHRQGEDLLIVAEFLHQPQARIEVVEHGDVGPAPHRRLVGNDLDHLVEIGFREDVREDVDLAHGGILAWRAGAGLLGSRQIPTSDAELSNAIARH